LYRIGNEKSWILFHHLLSRGKALAARVSGITKIFFLLPLSAAQFNFVGINHNNIVAGIHMWGKFSLVLASQVVRYFRSHTPQGMSFGINKNPFLFDITRLRRVGLVTISIHG